jgi:hypothetical protein
MITSQLTVDGERTAVRIEVLQDGQLFGYVGDEPVLLQKDGDGWQRCFDTRYPLSIESEMPEALAKQVEEYIKAKPGWDWNRATCAAFSLFLMQNGRSDRTINRLYLDSAFGGELVA